MAKLSSKSQHEFCKESAIAWLLRNLPSGKQIQLYIAVSTMSDDQINRLRMPFARMSRKQLAYLWVRFNMMNDYHFQKFLAASRSNLDTIYDDQPSKTPSRHVCNDDDTSSALVHTETSKGEANLDSGWLETQTRIQNLPEKLQMMIVEELCDGFALPGKIFTSKIPKSDSQSSDSNRVFRPSIPSPFSAFNRKLHAKYREKYLSGNTWVIGDGLALDTMSFLTNEAQRAAISMIKSIEVRFTFQDMAEIEFTAPFLNSTFAIPTHASLLRPEARLWHVWWHKLHTIAWNDRFTGLEDLTLDFSDAYHTGGCFLGVDFVRGLQSRGFKLGLPRNFVVKAPSDVTRDQVLGLFQAANRWLGTFRGVERKGFGW